MNKIADYQKQYKKDNKKHLRNFYKQWRKDKKEYIAEHARQYYLDNIEKIVKYRKKYRQESRTLRLEYQKRYAQTPAGRAAIKASHHNRRIALKGLTLEIIQSVYEDNIKKYGRLTCVLCFKPIKFGDDNLEHLTPLSRGGSNDFSNLGVAHDKCNNEKRAKTLKEWFADK